MGNRGDVVWADDMHESCVNVRFKKMRWQSSDLAGLA